MNLYRCLLSSVILLFNFHFVSAQGPQIPADRNLQDKGKISGKVIDSELKIPVEYATIVLYRAADSGMVNGMATNAKGEFSFAVPEYGKYNLKIEFIGYKTRHFQDIEISAKNSGVNIGTVSLEPSLKNVGQVEVQGERGQMQLALDKKVFNVEKDLSSTGGSATQVLQNVPSVTVDMDGVVSLRGSSNVRILVDGKPSSITGSSRAAILEQIPASSIESIEVITNPSAKYDAEGMSGIINIVLKKQKKSGLNGLFSLNAGTRNKYTGSANLNYGTGKFNFFGGYDARYDESGMNGEFNRFGLENGDTIYTLKQTTTGLFTGLSHNIRLGADFSINSNNALTVSGSYRKGDRNNNSEILYRQFDSLDNPASVFRRFNETDDSDQAFDYNLNYKRSFEKKGQSLSADVIYSESDENSEGDNTQRIYNLDDTPSSDTPVLQKTLTKNAQKNLSAQADYVHPFNEKSKLETGWKSSLREADADLQFLTYSDSAGDYEDAEGLSNHFIYKEQIHAGYASYSNGFGKFSYQAGIRVEHTETDPRLINTNEHYPTAYTSFFPSVFLARDLPKNNRLQVSYSRRINRPSFHMLNPFSDYSDPLNIRVGNPFLRPEMIDAYEIGHMKYWDKASFNSTVYYRVVNDVFRRVIRVDDENVSTLRFENLDKAQMYGVEGVFNSPLLSWWRINTSVNVFHIFTEGGDLGNSNNISYNGRLSSNMTIWKSTDLQVMGNYRGPFSTPQARIKSMYFVDLGFKKDILKNKASVTLRVSDVFNTQRFRIKTDGPNFDINGFFKRESQNVYVGFTYKLNNYKIRERKRSGGEENMDFGM